MGYGFEYPGHITSQLDDVLRWADVTYYQVLTPDVARHIQSKTPTAIPIVINQASELQSQFTHWATIIAQICQRGRRVALITWGNPLESNGTAQVLNTQHRALIYKSIPGISAVASMIANLGISGDYRVTSSLNYRQGGLVIYTNIGIYSEGGSGDFDVLFAFLRRNYDRNQITLYWPATGNQPMFVHRIAANRLTQAMLRPLCLMMIT